MRDALLPAQELKGLIGFSSCTPSWSDVIFNPAGSAVFGLRSNMLVYAARVHDLDGLIMLTNVKIEVNQHIGNRTPSEVIASNANNVSDPIVRSSIGWDSNSKMLFVKSHEPRYGYNKMPIRFEFDEVDFP